MEGQQFFRKVLRFFGEGILEKGMFHQNQKGWRARIWWRKCEAILGGWNFPWKGSNVGEKDEHKSQKMLGRGQVSSRYIYEKTGVRRPRKNGVN